MFKEKLIKGLKWFFHSYIWVGILLLIVDIVSKNLIVNAMTKEGDIKNVIPGFLRFSYVINRNAAFGFGPSDPAVSRILYMGFAIVASIGIGIYYGFAHKKLPGYVKAALMIIVAGAIGNLIDRVAYSATYLKAKDGYPGGVVDFIDFFWFWDYVFNIADCGFVIGTFMLAAYCIIDWIKDIKKQKAEAKANPADNKKVLSESEKRKLEEQEKNKVE